MGNNDGRTTNGNRTKGEYMNPARIDAITDLTYGVLILAAVLSMVVVETLVGVAFGLGVLISYIVHVVWKMSRFDPEWMTQEVTERVEESVQEVVEETVAQDIDAASDRISQELSDQVAESVTDEVERVVEEAGAS